MCACACFHHIILSHDSLVNKFTFYWPSCCVLSLKISWEISSENGPPQLSYVTVCYSAHTIWYVLVTKGLWLTLKICQDLVNLFHNVTVNQGIIGWCHTRLQCRRQELEGANFMIPGAGKIRHLLTVCLIKVHMIVRDPIGMPTRSMENMKWYSPSQVLTAKHVL